MGYEWLYTTGVGQLRYLFFPHSLRRVHLHLYIHKYSWRLHFRCYMQHNAFFVPLKFLRQKALPPPATSPQSRVKHVHEMAIWNELWWWPLLGLNAVSSVSPCRRRAPVHNRTNAVMLFGQAVRSECWAYAGCAHSLQLEMFELLNQSLLER